MSNDKRFTNGLIFDVVKALEKHGYKNTDTRAMGRFVGGLLELTQTFEGTPSSPPTAGNANRLDTADRIPIDSGEIRYQFVGKSDGQLEATFSGPHVGTVFAMTLDDARQMRDDLSHAIALLLSSSTPLNRE